MTNATVEKPEVATKPGATRRERRAARTRAEATEPQEQPTVTPETAAVVVAETPDEQPEPESDPKPTGKVEKATEWVMGKFTPNGIVVALRGDHNSIEKASAKLNKEAKMRVAFVVDIRAVPPALLVDTKFAAAEEAAMYGFDGGEDEDEGEEG